MFIPAGGQGIIAVEAKKGSEVLKILEKLNDKEAERALFAERKVLRLLRCRLYRGGWCVREGREWKHSGWDLMRETKNGVIRRQISGAAGGFHETRGASRKDRGPMGMLPAGKALSCGSRSGKWRTYHGKGTADLKGCGGPCLRSSWLRGTADSGAGGL